MGQKKRIGMVLDDGFPPDPRVENESLCLLNAGYEVCLIVLSAPRKSTNHQINPELQIVYVDPPKWVAKKLSALAYTIPIYHIWLGRKIRRFIEEFQIDFIHVHDLRIARAAFQANRTFRLPIILDLHENRPEIMKHYAHVNTFFGRLLIDTKTWARFEGNYIREADRSVVVTHEAKDHYVKQLQIEPAKIHVVPNTIDESFMQVAFQVSPPKSKTTFIYIGDTSERRGLMNVVNAFQFIPCETWIHIEVKVLGTSSFQEKLTNAVKNRGLENTIKLLGWKTYKEIHEELGTSHVGICPLHRNIHHNTTYANKLFQYMAYGLPLLVSDCDSQAKLATKNSCGKVHAAQDPVEIANAMIWFVQNPGELHTMGRNGFNVVREKYAIDGVESALVNLYRSLSD